MPCCLQAWSASATELFGKSFQYQEIFLGPPPDVIVNRNQLCGWCDRNAFVNMLMIMLSANNYFT